MQNTINAFLQRTIHLISMCKDLPNFLQTLRMAVTEILNAKLQSVNTVRKAMNQYLMLISKIRSKFWIKKIIIILALLTIFLLYRNHWITISGGRKSEICEPLRAACFVKHIWKIFLESQWSENCGCTSMILLKVLSWRVFIWVYKIFDCI